MEKLFISSFLQLTEVQRENLRIYSRYVLKLFKYIIRHYLKSLKEKINMVFINLFLEHKHWFKFKKENPDLFKKFRKDYMKNKKFLRPNQVGKFIYKVCNMNKFKINSKLFVVR